MVTNGKKNETASEITCVSRWGVKFESAVREGFPEEVMFV